MFFLISLFVNLLVKVVLLVFCRLIIIMMVGILGDFLILEVLVFNKFVSFLLIILIICCVGFSVLMILCLIVCLWICLIKVLIIGRVMLVFKRVRWIFLVIFCIFFLDNFFLLWIFLKIFCRCFVKFLKVINYFFLFNFYY